MKSLLALMVLFLMSGCAAFGPNGLRLVEPPVKNIDVAELSANLPPDKALLFQYRHMSIEPDSAVNVDNAATLSPGAMKDLIGFGAGLGGDLGAYAVLKSAIEKNRDIETLVVIADSDDVVKLRTSDNAAKIGSSQQSVDLLNHIVVEEPPAVTNAIVVTNAPPVVPEAGNPTNELPVNESEAFFRDLTWLRSDTTGPEAKVTKRLTFNSISPTGIRFQADPLADWGNAELVGVMCLAVQRGGRWEGGKFDHVRADTTSRDFNNVCGYINVCPGPANRSGSGC
ncbi:MAG TPA: hypothetical protein PKA21_08940 [Kiritimatiellia bacterium]|nr:hypothetical protein [Kiritimatiellia bacterium]HMP35021.1 hypothetical protein [Kiritimatiellia bacterium]